MTGAMQYGHMLAAVLSLVVHWIILYIAIKRKDAVIGIASMAFFGFALDTGLVGLDVSRSAHLIAIWSADFVLILLILALAYSILRRSGA